MKFLPWVFIGDGLNLLITNMLDIDGNEITDPKDVSTIVAPLPDGRWFTCVAKPDEIVKRLLH
jgi:hypothetical protein